VLDALEFACWNGEIVRIAFALDCHDREVIGWTVTTAGISGEMIRDMMVHCVERRFGTLPAPYRVQWLSDNGSILAAYDRHCPGAQSRTLLHTGRKTREQRYGRGLRENLQTRLRQGEPIPDATTALVQIDLWMEDYNTMHPHSRLATAHRGSAQSQPAACPV
jgi:putative transposase